VRLVSRRRTDARACARWDHASPTSPPEGPEDATVDEYIGEARLIGSEDATGAFERLTRRLFAYDIFPPRLMRHVVCPPGPLAAGTLVVQQVGLAVLAVESAVRVVETWDRTTGSQRSAGFRYVTLAGHPERGCASFEVRLTGDGRVEVVLGARSRAGSLLTTLGRPVARWIQTSATRAALRRLTEALAD
jgi:uncharacterized protein (UPF0548 family)